MPEPVKKSSPPVREESTAAPVSAEQGSAAPSSAPRILVADQNLSNRRLISEILTSFHRCDVDGCATAEHAFERVLQQPYDLFIFAFTLPEMSGLLLDRMISRLYPLVHEGKNTAPPVIFLVPANESAAYKETQRDARTRGSIPLPMSLDVLMTLVSPLLPQR